MKTILQFSFLKITIGVFLLVITFETNGKNFIQPDEIHSMDFTKKNPDEKRIISRGRHFEKTGKLSKAIALYNEGLTKFPKSYILYYFRGNARLESGDILGAIQDLSSASKYNHACVQAHIKKAYALFKLNQFHESLGELESAYKIDSTFKEIYYLKGKNFINIGDTIQAKSNLEMAIDLDPKYDLAYLTLAKIEMISGDLKRALNFARLSIKYDCNNPEAHKCMGEILCKYKKYSNALLEYKKAERLGYTDLYGYDLIDLMESASEKCGKKNYTHETIFPFYQ